MALKFYKVTFTTANLNKLETHFVKAHQIDLAADINSLWADAENANTF